MVRTIQTVGGRLVQIAPGVWWDSEHGGVVGEDVIDRAGVVVMVVETPIGELPQARLFLAGPYAMVCAALIAGVLGLTLLTVHMVHLKRDRDALAETAASWLTLKIEGRR